MYRNQTEVEIFKSETIKAQLFGHSAFQIVALCIFLKSDFFQLYICKDNCPEDLNFYKGYFCNSFNIINYR